MKAEAGAFNQARWIDEVALHVEDEFALIRHRARGLGLECGFGGQSKNRQCGRGAFAALNESSVEAAPQAEIRKSLFEMSSRLALRDATSCASRFASRLAGDKGTGTNSPFEVESSLIGRRDSSGPVEDFMRESIGLLAR